MMYGYFRDKLVLNRSWELKGQSQEKSTLLQIISEILKDIFKPLRNHHGYARNLSRRLSLNKSFQALSLRD